MGRGGLDKKQVLRKHVQLSQNMCMHIPCMEIAKYLFHYPRGTNFAECLYYTRYHYPDSFLVCLGLDVQFSPKPRIFRRRITPSSSRVCKSQSVHFQLSILRDQSRGPTRYYDELARFRLLELVEHFKGAGEAILKSCCKLAVPSDEDDPELAAQKDDSDGDYSSDSGDEDGADSVNGTREGGKGVTNAIDLTVNSTPDQNVTSNGWEFSSSISFHRPVHDELGHITSNVSATEIRDHMDVCITSADKVANEAIMSRFNAFEKQCKRAAQLSIKSVKVSKLKRRVTGASLASIPSFFANNFANLLKQEIKRLWKHELPADFFEGKLQNLIRSVLSAANTLYRMNGKTFFKLNMKDDVLDGFESEVDDQGKDEDDLTPKKKSRRHQVTTIAADTKKGLDHHPQLSNRVELLSFGLGMCTALETRFTTSHLWDRKFFSFLFHVLKGCLCQPRSEDSLHGGVQNGNSSDECSSCQQRLKATKEECRRAIGSLQQSVSKMWAEEGDYSLGKKLRKLKFKILSHVSSSMTASTATRYQHFSSGSTACHSNLFCYDIPLIDRSTEATNLDVTDGQGFRIYHAGGQGGEEVMWNYEVRSMSYRQVGDEEAQLFKTTDKVYLTDIPISVSKVPNTYILSAVADVLSSMDMWNEVDFEVDGEQYLGFRRFDVMKVVFKFQGGDSETASAEAASVTPQSFALIGIVLNDPVAVGESGPRVRFNYSDLNRMRSIGPRTCKINIIVQDDLGARLGQSQSITDFIDKWTHCAKNQATCRLIPVQGIDFRRDVLQYGSLQHGSLLPKIFRLSIVDFRYAECYEQERRSRHYQLMKHFLSPNPDDKYCFGPLRVLEERWRETVRDAVLSLDPEVNDQQLRVIETAL